MRNRFKKMMEINANFLNVYNLYTSTLEKVPNLVSWILALVGFSQSYEDLEVVCQQRTVGRSDLKRKSRGILIERTRVILSRVSQWALTEGKDAVYRRCMDCLHGLMSFSDSGLMSMSEGVFQIVEEHKDSWEQIGITQEMVDGMLNAKEDFVGLRNAPKALKKAKMKAHAEMEEVYEENKEMVYKRIFPTIFYEFKDSDPDLVLLAKSALKSESVHHSELAVRGRVVDVDSGEVVRFAVIEIEAIGLKRRLKGVRGGFTIAHLDDGEYVLRVTHPAYEDVEVRFIHTDGIRDELLIEMRARVVAGVE